MKLGTIKVGIGGEFRLVKRNCETGEITKTPWMKNLVTDHGLNALFQQIPTGNGNVWGATCGVGTGTAPPVVGDTALAAPVAYESRNSEVSVRSNSGAPDYITGHRLDFTFPQGTFNGVTLNEVGLSSNNISSPANSNFVTRALISPNITVLAIEELTVQYTINFYAPANTTTGTININGGPSNVGWSINAASADSVDFGAERFPNYNMRVTGAFRDDDMTWYKNATALGTITDGTPTNAASITAGGLTVPTLSNEGQGVADVTWTGATNQVNDTNVNAAVFDIWCGKYKMYLDTGFTKDNTQTISITLGLQVLRHT